MAKATQFLLVSLVGALLNVSAASYVATFVPAFHEMEIYWPSIAALAGTACGLASNFLAYKHIVFAVNQPNRDGEIRAVSQPNWGTTVSFTLPSDTQASDTQE